MKCSECTRRNSDDNRFCIYCGTALTPPEHQAASPSRKVIKKVVLPPQDIDELISDRYQVVHKSHSNPLVHPAVVVSLVIILGLSSVYYWFFYQDVYQIMAIDYEGTQLINE